MKMEKLVFNIEEKSIEFMGNSFPMCDKIVSELRKGFGNKSVELSLDTSKETEDTLRGIFSFSHEFEGDEFSLYLTPPKEEYDSSHGESDYVFSYWEAEVFEGEAFKNFCLQRAGDGKPALNWVEDSPLEDLRGEYLDFEEHFSKH